MRVGQARKRDANEAAVVEALRAIGCRVARISEPGAPDLVAEHDRLSRAVLIEVKSKTGKLTPRQLEAQRVGWRVYVVRTPEEALALFYESKPTK